MLRGVYLFLFFFEESMITHIVVARMHATRCSFHIQRGGKARNKEDVHQQVFEQQEEEEEGSASEKDPPPKSGSEKIKHWR